MTVLGYPTAAANSPKPQDLSTDEKEDLAIQDVLAASGDSGECLHSAGAGLPGHEPRGGDDGAGCGQYDHAFRNQREDRDPWGYGGVR